MKGIVYEIAQFYIGFNLAIWMIAAMVTTGVLALGTQIQPFSPPASLDFTTNVATILGNPLAILGMGITGAAALISLFTGHNLLGFGLITLIALTFLVPVLSIVFGLGLATMIRQILTQQGIAGNVIDIITIPLGVIMALVELVFVAEFLGQRDFG